MKYGYLINIAKSQFWLEMYDECEKTCKELITNDYDEYDAEVILKDIKNVKEKMAKCGLNTRHLDVSGLESFNNYQHKVVKETFGDFAKQFAKELKSDAKSIQSAYKEKMVRRKITDSIFIDENDFSEFKTTIDGIEFLTPYNKFYKSMAFNDTNSRESYSKNNLYTLNFIKKTPLLRDPLLLNVSYELRLKNKVDHFNEVKNFKIEFVNNYFTSKNYNADTLLSLIKLYEKDNISHITNSFSDSISIFNGSSFYKPTYIFEKDYKKKLSYKIELNIDFKDDISKRGNYRSISNEKINFNIESVTKINLIGCSAVKKTYAYLVKANIPKIKLNKYIETCNGYKFVEESLFLESTQFSFLIKNIEN